MWREREPRNEETVHLGVSRLETLHWRGPSPAGERLEHLANAFMAHNLQPATVYGKHCQSDTLQRFAPMVPTFCVRFRQTTHSKR